ncbi:MAG: hypothetical protein ACJ741_21115 [Pyrinomonadaceae bacterium]
MSKTSSFDNRDDYPHLETLSSGSSNPVAKLIAFVSAVALVVALLCGFLFLRKQHEEQLSAAKRAEQVSRTIAPAQAQVFQDEVRLRGSDAIVGGSVRNISAARLEDLFVEVELKRRASQTVETKTVQLSPGSLRPGEEGKYSLQISSSEWSGAQVVRLRGGAAKAEIPFKTELGEKRPAERPPAAKVIIEQRPRRQGDDYINTPDTPIRIP